MHIVEHNIYRGEMQQLTLTQAFACCCIPHGLDELHEILLVVRKDGTSESTKEDTVFGVRLLDNDGFPVPDV